MNSLVDGWALWLSCRHGVEKLLSHQAILHPIPLIIPQYGLRLSQLPYLTVENQWAKKKTFAFVWLGTYRTSCVCILLKRKIPSAWHGAEKAWWHAFCDRQKMPVGLQVPCARKGQRVKKAGCVKKKKAAQARQQQRACAALRFILSFIVSHHLLPYFDSSNGAAKQRKSTITASGHWHGFLLLCVWPEAWTNAKSILCVVVWFRIRTCVPSYSALRFAL